jgi:DNA-binding PadR family transcriptional regulator
MSAVRGAPLQLRTRGTVAAPRRRERDPVMSGRFLDAYFEVFGPEEGRLALQLRLLRRTHGTPRLMLAVLEEAIECCWRHAKAYESRKYHLFREAYRWIQSRDRGQPFAFEDICDALGVSAARIRRCIRAWRERADAERTPRTGDQGGPRRAESVYARTRRLRSRRRSGSGKVGGQMEARIMKTTEKHGGTLLSLKDLRSHDRQHRAEREAQAEPRNPLSEVDHVTLGYLRMYAGGIHGYRLGRVLSRSPLCIPSLRLPRLYRVLRRLEHAGLVSCTVQAGGSRLRYLFTITRRGESRFRRWLTGTHNEFHLTPDQLLNRLRFADQLSAGVMLGLIDDTGRACQRALENLPQHTGYKTDSAPPTNELYTMALEARLAAEQGWLEKVRKLVEESLATAREATGAAQQACAL